MKNITETGISAQSLRKFASEEEFQAYLLNVRAHAEERGAWWARTNRVSRFPEFASTAQNPIEEASCSPDDPDCVSLEEVVVTASKVSSSSDSSTPMSITNNQEIGVDEGDIIKLLGRFLIVLQDGRLFTIDTGYQSGSLQLVDRFDIYIEKKDQIWYDELLVSGSHLVVIGYNWYEDRSEITLLEMSDAGFISHKSTYHIESNDYYSSENYASRMVDGQLVFYSPFYLTEFEFDERIPYPRIRRWTQEEGLSEWSDLFTATDLYRPVQGTMTPTIHATTRCSIEEFFCESTGILESETVEFYVSPTYLYLWAAADLEVYYDSELPECPTDQALADLPGWKAMLYRVPHSGEPTEATLAAGMPHNQFAMEEREDSFYALVSWLPAACDQTSSDSDPQVFVRLNSRNFSSRPVSTRGNSYTAAPEVPGRFFETRFSRNHLLYTGTESPWFWYSQDDENSLEPTTLTAIPLSRPGDYLQLNLTHTGNRLELLGEYAVVNGYSRRDALDFTLVDLKGIPRVADVTSVPGARESEGRSHAFNGLLDNRDGSGVFAVPTIYKHRLDALLQREIWPELPSDLTFMSIDSSQTMAGAGQLFATDEPIDNDYVCEVSCEDWYGNARAVFIGNRVFAITGDELIEGELTAGSINEIYRIRITEPISM